MSCNITLRVSSYEPGFRDLALLASKFSVPETSVFPTAISVSGAETFVLWALQPGYRDESGIKSGVQMALFCHLCLLYFSHHNCSDTALRVTKAMIGAKVIIFVFRHVCLFLEFRARTHPQDYRPCHLAIRAENSHMNLRRNCSCKPGSCEEVLNQLLLLLFSLPSPSSLLKLPIEMWSEAADKFSCVRKYH